MRLAVRLGQATRRGLSRSEAARSTPRGEKARSPLRARPAPRNPPNREQKPPHSSQAAKTPAGATLLPARGTAFLLGESAPLLARGPGAPEKRASPLPDAAPKATHSQPHRPPPPLHPPHLKLPPPREAAKAPHRRGPQKTSPSSSRRRRRRRRRCCSWPWPQPASAPSPPKAPQHAPRQTRAPTAFYVLRRRSLLPRATPLSPPLWTGSATPPRRCPDCPTDQRRRRALRARRHARRRPLYPRRRGEPPRWQRAPPLWRRLWRPFG